MGFLLDGWEFMNRGSISSNKYFKLERLIQNTIKYIDQVLPGVMRRIDWHFYRIYNVKFIDYFLRKPVEAYRILLDVYGVEREEDRHNVNHIVYLVLKGLFTEQRRFIDRAYNALINGDEETFKAVVNEYLDKI